MTNPASTDDLVSRWRPLTDLERVNGKTFLDDAWGMLRRKDSTLETRMAADTSGDLANEVSRVLATAVLRVMRNPDGKRQEAIDDYSWTRDQALSAGLLYFTDDELDSLTDDPSTRGPAFSFSLLPSGYPDSVFP